MICRFSICSYVETYIYINLVNRWWRYQGNFSSLLKITRSTSRRSYFLHIIKIKIKLRIKASLRRKNAFPLQKYITNNNNNNRMEEHCAPIETSVATFYIFKLRLIERHSSLNKANYLSVSRGNSREYRSVNLFSFPVRGLIGRGMAKKKKENTQAKVETVSNERRVELFPNWIASRSRILPIARNLRERARVCNKWLEPKTRSNWTNCGKQWAGVNEGVARG